MSGLVDTKKVASVDELISAGRVQGTVGADGFFTQSDQEFQLDLANNSFDALRAHLEESGYQAGTVQELKQFITSDKPHFTPLG